MIVTSQGTTNMMALAAALREAAPGIKSAVHLGHGSLLMMQAAVALERLAVLEPDIEVSPGEN